MSYLLDNKELMKDWNYIKNKDIDLASLTHGSNKRVWWKCPKCGFEWNTKVCNRASTLARGCPSCSRLKAARSNSLTRAKQHNIAQDYPNIAAEWHPTKNGKLTPDKISYGSEKIVWWKCSKCGYEWQTSPNHRTRKTENKHTIGCPKCAIKNVSSYNKVQIINLDTKQIFNSLTEAAASVGGKKSSLCGHLNGKAKTFLGYHWDYVDKSKRRRKTCKEKIKNLDKNIIFENSKSAAKWCNGDSRTINRCCNGVTKTAYGYHWEYIH